MVMDRKMAWWFSLNYWLYLHSYPQYRDPIASKNENLSKYEKLYYCQKLTPDTSELDLEECPILFY